MIVMLGAVPPTFVLCMVQPPGLSLLELSIALSASDAYAAK